MQAIPRISDAEWVVLQVLWKQAGAYQYQVLTKSWSGWKKSRKTIAFTVQETAPKLVSVTPEQEVVRTGDAIVLIADVNAPVARIEVTDETGAAVKSQLTELAAKKGLLQFRLEVPAGQPEIGKILQCTAYKDDGIASDTVRTAVSILQA